MYAESLFRDQSNFQVLQLTSTYIAWELQKLASFEGLPLDAPPVVFYTDHGITSLLISTFVIHKH